MRLQLFAAICNLCHLKQLLSTEVKVTTRLTSTPPFTSFMKSGIHLCGPTVVKCKAHELDVANIHKSQPAPDNRHYRRRHVTSSYSQPLNLPPIFPFHSLTVSYFYIVGYFQASLSFQNIHFKALATIYKAIEQRFTDGSIFPKPCHPYSS